MGGATSKDAKALGLGEHEGGINLYDPPRKAYNMVDLETVYGDDWERKLLPPKLRSCNGLHNSYLNFKMPMRLPKEF